MAVFSAPSFDQHELVAFCEDRSTGLRAIIAVHSSQLGPAVGGLRMYPYADDAAALDDVLRLSRGMTYKSALAGLPVGGGKAVIIGDPSRDKNAALFKAMAGFIDSLGGRYVTAEDSGTTVADMAQIAKHTCYVSGLDSHGGGDPSPYTAYGVYCGLRAALRQQRGSDNLDGVRVAIQGAGAVGSHLARRLIEDGATVLVADVNPTLLTPLQALGAEVVEPPSILSQPVDVLAPCAMGAVLNAETVQQVRASIIAGAANNQLATPAQAQQLADRGVLYVPDFVINAGGIIAVYHQRQHGGALSADAESTLLQHVEGIGDKLGLIFKRAAQQLCPPHMVAEAMAEEVLLAQGKQAATEN